MSKTLPFKLYDLIPSQQSMYLMLKYSIHKQVMQVPSSIALKDKLDFDLLLTALNVEIARNDCLRLRFVKLGRGLNAEVKQFFLPAWSVTDVPVKNFKTYEEQEAVLTADAQTPIRIFKDETFRVVFFTTADGRTGIYLNVSHLVMDAAATAVFYKDLLEVYRSLATGTELPKPLYSYREYIVGELAMLQNKEKMEKGAAFYHDFFEKDGCPFYAGVHGHDLLDAARKKTGDPNLRIPQAYDPIHDKALLLEKKIDPETAAKFFDFCKANLVSPETLMQFGYRAHVSKLNYDTDDTLSLQLCSKRVTFKEKNMGGCLTQPLQVRAIIKDEFTFKEALTELDKVKNSLYRHMFFPYTEALAIERKMYNLKATQMPSFMMFTWLPMISGGEHEIEFRGYNIGRYVMPLYTFTYPDGKDMGIKFHYLYRINSITEQHLEALHSNMIKAVLAGIENPDLTFGEIKAALD
ncbi:MAG: hypothetical protein K6C36_07585 [Clostridia bacterium]|nr:hypothetical protein [Clostridia bacterium]